MLKCESKEMCKYRTFNEREVFGYRFLEPYGQRSGWFGAIYGEDGGIGHKYPPLIGGPDYITILKLMNRSAIPIGSWYGMRV